MFGPGGYGWQWHYANVSADAAIIAGYRLADSLLIYGGTYYLKYWLTGNIHQDASVDGTSPANDYPFSINSIQNGYNLGLEWRFGHWGFLQAEVFYSSYQLTGASSAPNLTGAAFEIGGFFN